MPQLSYDAKSEIVAWCAPPVALVLSTVDREWRDVVLANGYRTLLRAHDDAESCRALEVLLRLHGYPRAWQGARKMRTGRVQALLLRAAHFKFFRLISLLVHCTDASACDYTMAVACASRAGRIDVVDEILSSEQMTTAKFCLALPVAAEAGQLAVVELLLSHPRMKVDAATLRDGFLAACRSGRVEVVETLLPHMEVPTAPCNDLENDSGLAHFNRATRLASANGHAAIVRLLVASCGVDPSADNNYAIGMASENGHAAVVAMLLQDARVDPSDDGNYAIIKASLHGHTSVVRHLLADSRVNATYDDNFAVRLASHNGHSDVVRLLLTDPRVDPAANNNYAIRKASEHGHAAVVRLLLADARVDPTAEENYALRRAREDGHAAVVRLLLADGRATL